MYSTIAYSVMFVRVCVNSYFVLLLSVEYWCSRNKKLIRRWDSQTWLDDIGCDMPDSPVWPPPSCLFGYLRGVAQPHAGKGDLLGGGDPLGRSSWFLVGELPDGQAAWCKNIAEKLNPWVGYARTSQTTDTTDDNHDRRVCHAISQT